MFKRLVLSVLLSVPASAFALTDQSTDLRALLENGTLSAKDCERYRAGEHDEETKLRCGKYMFFYDTLGLPGLPSGMIDLLRKKAPNTVGKSFEGFGLIADPFSQEGLPLGFVKGPRQTGWLESYTPTCATCHVAKIADGRYVVGQPNHDFDFGGMVLTVSSLPELATQPKKVQPLVVSNKLKAVKEEFFGSGWASLSVIAEVIKLLPNVVATGKKPLSDGEKIVLAEYPRGVLDGFAAPVFDDGVLTPQRILPLWGINPKAMLDAGSQHGAMLTSSGGQANLSDVFLGIAMTASIADGKNYFDLYGAEYFDPLEAYILSLKAPKNLASFDAQQISRGQSLFNANCVSCHNAPDASGTRIFTVEEMGTDPNQALYLDPQGTGKALQGLLKDSEMTGGIKASRLTGIWTFKRLLHNGSLTTLDELFCLNNPRPPSQGNGYSTAGHTMTCDGLSRDEKVDLIKFVQSL